MATDEKLVSGPGKKPQSKPTSSHPDPKAKPAGGSASDKPPLSGVAQENAANPLNQELAQLQQKLVEAEQTAAQHWDALLRAKAEHDNTRKRLERDVENAHKFALERFAQDLLPVIDSLEMGISAANEVETDITKLREGNVLTLKMFTDCANKFGIEAINPLGQAFNPEFHQAMSIQQSADYPPDTVMAVMQKGYTLNGRLIRPAMVIVAKEVEKQATENQAENNNPK